jgi:LPXTG-motif cell wall-anchored protein
MGSPNRGTPSRTSPTPTGAAADVPVSAAPRSGLRRAVTACAVTVGASLVATSLVAAAPAPVATTSHSGAAVAPVVPSAVTPEQEATLERYAADTYDSLAAMTDPATGLPADNIGGALDPATRSAYTSPTNIGGYLWSTVMARDLGIVTADEAYDLMSMTLATVDGLDRHEPSGMFYNWYDPATGDRVRSWPGDGAVVEQFLSSVDNGWLAAALRVVAEAEPRLADEATAIYDDMNFGVYYNADALPDRGLGLLRGGFWDEKQTEGSVPGDYLGTGQDVYYTGHHYDTTVSETRIATYLGIAEGDVPPETYYATWRTFPSTCDWAWQESRPSGVTRTYLGVDVFEGAYSYRGMSIVPGWGGSMFEALMPDMLVPESEWGPTSWGVNHPLVVEAQKQHGLDEAGYGYWGFSPASNPFGGYAEYGVDQLGMRDDGYLSDGVTNVDVDSFGCAEGTNPDPEYQDGVVTPHASFLGLSYDPEGVLANLDGLESDFDSYGPGGFYDAIAVRSGTVAQTYLSLDQSMIMAAIGNYLTDGSLQDYFVDDQLEAALRPLMEAEVFSASAEAVVPVLDSPAAGTVLTDPRTTFSGTGEPGAELTVTATPTGDVAALAVQTLCTAPVDADGAWSCDGQPTLAPGTYALAISTTSTAGVTTPGEVDVTVEVAAAPTEEPTPPAPTDPAPTDPAPAPETTAPVAPGAGGGGSTDGDGADRSAQGGDLAETGTDGAPVLAGAALLTVLLGAATVLLARRRRLG